MAARQGISGLPETRGDQDYYRYNNDVHMDTARGTIGGLPDIRMDTAKGYTVNNDIAMDTARGNTTLKVGPLKVWERELVDNPEIKRKSTVAQLCASCARSCPALHLKSDLIVDRR